MLKPAREISALEVALDVLQTFSLALRAPDREKVAKLRALAQDPLERSLPDDELARFVVQRELGRRAGSSMVRRADRAA
jgi:hypothetical protein